MMHRSNTSGAATVSSRSGQCLVPQAFSKFQKSAIPKVPSLVFDLELEDAGLNVRSNDMTIESVAEDVRLLQRFLMPASSAQQKLAEDVASTLSSDERSVNDMALLARLLTPMGYSPQVRHALGGGADCLRNLRHSFVQVTLPGTFMRRPKYIIDPHFREQFEIAKPTDRYAAILDAVPPCLIISQDNIARLVTFLCAELMAAFKANETVLPPWRQSDSMLSKWLPRKSMDQTFPSHGGSLASPGASGVDKMDAGVMISHQEGPPALSHRPSHMEPYKIFFGGNFRTVSAIL